MASRSMASSSSLERGRGWVKSKRRRSGATREPYWRTWGPRILRSSAWSTWVAVWWRMMSQRRSTSISARAGSPTLTVPLVTWPTWTMRPGTGRRVSVTFTTQTGSSISAGQ